MTRQGFAKKQFVETFQRTPWLTVGQKGQGVHWPLLDAFLAQNRITYIDYDLTRRLLESHPSASQEAAFFICHLVQAAREGHLCIQAEDNVLHPSAGQLWHHEEGDPLSSDEASLLTQWVLEGAKQVPPGLIASVDGGALPNAPLCKDGSYFYLQKHWIYETLFLKNLRRHLEVPLTIPLSRERVEREVSQLLANQHLQEEQAQAILEGCLNPFTLVTGGPGTGKTYTAGHLIKVFWECLSDEEKKGCQIALAAPTGKAAANLQRSIGKVADQAAGFPQLQAKTLHGLLGIKSSRAARESVQLTADLVVIDESSMLDIRMMASLFESLKPGSRLILLGDKDQLPAVEAGSLFVDLLNLPQSELPFQIPTVSLSVCMRAELRSLVDFARLINQGSAEDVLALLGRSAHGIQRLQFEEEGKGAQERFISHAVPYFPSAVHLGERPEELLNLFQKIRVLTPLKKGMFGSETLNQAIWHKISQKAPMNGFMAVPIIIAANDYRQELFNGETGVLIRRLPLQNLTSDDYALFPSKEREGQVRRLPALLLPRFELAYCLSVHKSQGSEFDHVILALPEGSELFGRELLYTAVTRARKSLEIYGSDLVIQKTVEHKGERLSGLEHRLTTKQVLNQK